MVTNEGTFKLTNFVISKNWMRQLLERLNVPGEPAYFFVEDGRFGVEAMFADNPKPGTDGEYLPNYRRLKMELTNEDFTKSAMEIFWELRNLGVDEVDRLATPQVTQPQWNNCSRCCGTGTISLDRGGNYDSSFNSYNAFNYGTQECPVCFGAGKLYFGKGVHNNARDLSRP